MDPEGGNADILVLIDEIGIPRKDKKALIEGFRSSVGMSLDEKYGTLAFSGPLSVLGEVSDQVVEFINEYQLAGKIFPAIRRDVIDQEFRDRLLRYAVFERYWEVDEDRAVILTYDINHDDGRSGKRYHTLQGVGALKIFQSCYWIPEEKANIVRREFGALVEESRRERREASDVQYHFRVFRCYPIGSPEGLRRWKDLQLNLFLEKIKTLYERSRGKWNWFNYVRRAFPTLSEDDKARAMKKVKRMRYWKGRVGRELEPYREAHLRRMRGMGLAEKEVEEELVVDTYGDHGEKERTRRRISLTAEEALSRLGDLVDEMHEIVYAFIEEVEAARSEEEIPVTSDDLSA